MACADFESESVAPTEPTPQLIGDGFASAICSLGIRPQILTGYFIEHLRRHFVSPYGIEEPDLRRLIWHRDEAPAILIESIFNWKPQETELRPAILVKRNSYENFRAGIDDRNQGIPMDREGNESFETFWTGSHTIFCIATTGAQVELLGTEVQRQLTEAGPEVRKSLGLFKYQVKQVGPVSEIEEATENFAVPVTVAWAYSEAWTIRPVAPVFRGLTLANLLGLC
jgi:hypothetical protein